MGVQKLIGLSLKVNRNKVGEGTRRSRWWGPPKLIGSSLKANRIKFGEGGTGRSRWWGASKAIRIKFES